MKLKCYIGKEALELEVYKVQVSIFGCNAVLIYNEDRTQTWKETDKNNIKAIRNFIGKDIMKTYIVGRQDKKGRIVMMKPIPYDTWKEFNW